MPKPIMSFVRIVDNSFERVQNARDRMVFENQFVEPFDEVHRCALSDTSVRNGLKRESVSRLGIIARYAKELAEYHSFCEKTLGIDPDFYY
jgi:hypothetical protein